MDTKNFTIHSFQKGFSKREFSSVEITRELLQNIKKENKDLNAYLSVFEESAIAEAERADKLREEKKPLSPLTGVPLVIKDNILIKGEKATAASKILQNYVSAYDATVIDKLRRENSVFLGKTNLDEFAMGASTENSAFGAVKNPHDKTKVPGGSSGGSAAAVAGNLALGALGSDTGGSVRQPSAFCGTVGLRPTYGTVSRFGLIAMASSLDQIGPITKTVRDATILYDAIKGGDEFDATWGGNVESPISEMNFESLKGLTIGIPKEYFEWKLDPEVERGIEEVKQRFSDLGCTFKDISLPHTKYAVSCYYIIMPAEVSSNLARFDGIRYGRSGNEEKVLKDIYFNEKGKGFGEETIRRVLLGTFVLSSGYYDAYYAKAQKVRQLIKNDFDEAFVSGVDVILTPTTPTVAFNLGEKSSDPLSMYLADIFTVASALAGVPAISVPVKKYPLGGELPVGFQLIGKYFDEKTILRAGIHYEED